MSLTLTIFGSTLAGMLASGGFWAYLQYRRSQKLGIDGDTNDALKARSADWQAYVDRLTQRMDAQDEKIYQLEQAYGTILAEQAKDNIYIDLLINHINQGHPPPPPERP